MAALRLFRHRSSRFLAPTRSTFLRTFGSASTDQTGNNAPIILVHGVMGWGRDELLGLKYFGGLHGDVEKKLRDKGYDVRTAAVGPVSSNWDRACELYAQIKGGTVDYGEDHAKLHGHSRYGKTFPGLYTDWGTLDENGNRRKIHLVGHSMGGQTIRTLSQLLAHGTEGAPTREASPNASPLFKGGNTDWIHSITSISTPHDGTVLADSLANAGNSLKALLTTFAGFLGTTGSNSQYDFKLDQWGISPKQDNESIFDYVSRISNSKIFEPGFKDFSLYDLTMQGAKELNDWVKDQENIYYFSYSTADTYKQFLLPVHHPYLTTMTIPLVASAYLIGGHYTTLIKGLEAKWQENDGAVPKESQRGPDGADILLSGTPSPGKWHYMPHLERTDHLAVCGWRLLKDPTNIYENHAKLLKNLPTIQQNVTSYASVCLEPHEHIEDIKSCIESWNEHMTKEHTPDEIKQFHESLDSDVAKKVCQHVMDAQHP